MSESIRKILRRILPSIQQRIVWTKNEEDVINLLKQYFILDRTSKDDIKSFLQNNRISFDKIKQDSSKSSSDDELLIILPGPSIWRGLIPFGSQYQIRFQFSDNILSNIEASLVEYHF